MKKEKNEKHYEIYIVKYIGYWFYHDLAPNEFQAYKENGEKNE